MLVRQDKSGLRALGHKKAARGSGKRRNLQEAVGRALKAMGRSKAGRALRMDVYLWGAVGLDRGSIACIHD